jgi:type II secretion system protein C
MVNDRQISRLFWAAKAGLVVLLLYALVGAVLTPFRLDTALKPNAVAGDEQTRAFVAVVSDNEAATDYDAIVESDIFAGTNTKADAGVSQIADSMPSAEELGLKLVGAIAFPTSPAASYAIIENTQTKAAQPYKTGDTVASATIESIEADRVILSYAGQRCVLVLRTATSTTGQAGPTENIGPNATTTEKVPTANKLGPQTSARLSYVESVFQKATIEPHVQNGRTEGLIITGLDQTPLTAALGLRNGDIVRNVNGQNLTSKQKAFQVLKKARMQSTLDIELLRNGKIKNLSFDL